MIDLEMKGDNMGTTTDTYRKKKKLKEEQERRLENQKEQLEKMAKENSK